MTEGFWTEEKVARLRELWPSTASDTEIGNELGCSRSAAGGKAMRLGLGKRGSARSRGAVFVTKARDRSKKVEARVKLPSITQAKHGIVKTRGSARNPGFTIQNGLKMTKSEMREMLRKAVENTK